MRAFRSLRAAAVLQHQNGASAASLTAAAAARCHYAPARSLLCAAEDAAASLPPLCQDGHLVAWSGFTGVGYPKAMPLALLAHVRRRAEKEAAEAKRTGPRALHLPRLTLLSGASTGTEPEDAWAEAGLFAFRAPYQGAPKLMRAINKGSVLFADAHLSKFCDGIMGDTYSRALPPYALNLRYGDPAVTGRPLPPQRTDGRLDLAVVEATAIDAHGGIILSHAVGATPELLHKADNIIIELNSALPDLTGFHDLVPATALSAPGQPLPLTHVGQRIGTTSLAVDWSRVRAVVATAAVDVVAQGTAPDEVSERISSHMLDFFAHEVRRGRIPANLPPIQSGIGNIANAVVAGLGTGGFRDLNVWSEVVQDSFIPLIKNGQVIVASTASLKLSESAQKEFKDNLEFFKDKIVLRQQAISNCPELIHRLGVLCLNTPVEVDIYGHANSTCVLGSRMVHGLGGSGDFLRHARLNVLHTPSIRASKSDPEGISCIVPMVSHVDHTEHDVDVICTEQGLADLRGLAPRERARHIIHHCAHPTYKPLLMDYLEQAERRPGAAQHEPHMIECALQMHGNLQANDTMKVKQWNKAK